MSPYSNSPKNSSKNKSDSSNSDSSSSSTSRMERSERPAKRVRRASTDDSSSDANSQQSAEKSQRTFAHGKQINQVEVSSSSSSEAEIKKGIRRKRDSQASDDEDSKSSSSSNSESRPSIKRVRTSRKSQSPHKSSTSSLTEAPEVLSSLSDTESETQEPPSPPETPGHPRKRRLSQSESSDETEEDTDITTEPQSPPNSPIPQNPCKVCGGFEPMDIEYPLIVCAGCQICVHTDCYGISNRKPMGRSWRCDPCLNGRVRNAIKVKKCVLCNQPEGANNAMKRTNGNNWAHVLCTTFIPETSFYEPENVFLVMDIEDVKDERWNVKPGGACIQCSSSCDKYFHVTCAQEAGYHLGFEVKPFNVVSSRLDTTKASSSSKSKAESVDNALVDMNQTVNEGFNGEMTCKVYCSDHDVPEGFLTMSTRDSQSHQSALYAYIKKYKKYDLSQREHKLKTRYTLTIPEHIKAQMDAQKAWYELSTTDDDSNEDSSEDEIVNRKSSKKKMEDVKLKGIEDALIKSNILRPSDKQCSRCSVTRTIKWWPDNWAYLPRSERFSIRDALSIICHRCYQKEKALIGEVSEAGIKTEDIKQGWEKF
ncbi:2890_t:CDS:2 [Acaulospora morrowiae]|uniref:2890_t:CDS:1 n=1 Tax=Acaulospora morrowiae TaxID=94023 RepID=A0A9N9EC62_9GLOM|nr:2890_t:CDS:2 [Acaulospora morrowiae]